MSCGDQLIVLALEVGNELQMPAKNLCAAICLDSRQSLDEITQITRDALQIVFHEITPYRSGQLSTASDTGFY